MTTAQRERAAADIADTLTAQTIPADTDPKTRDLLRCTAYAAALTALTTKENAR